MPGPTWQDLGCLPGKVALPPQRTGQVHSPGHTHSAFLNLRAGGGIPYIPKLGVFRMKP